jgi:hypothetical protein
VAEPLEEFGVYKLERQGVCLDVAVHRILYDLHPDWAGRHPVRIAVESALIHLQ